MKETFADISPGDHTSSRFTLFLGDGTRQTQYEGALQRLLHRHWCCDSFIWRDRFPLDWLFISSRRRHFRSYSSDDGSKTAFFIRVQDGSIGLILLLCSSLCYHEWSNCIIRGSSIYQSCGRSKSWNHNTPDQCSDRIWSERQRCILGEYRVILGYIIILIVGQIGRTSSLVMTLCGVLKDIMLVCASIMIWGNPVTKTQFFGYSIALAGMVHYKLGSDNLKSAFSDASRKWAEYGQKRPVQRKVVTFGGGVFLLMILIIGLAPSLGYSPAPPQVIENHSWWQSLMNGGYWAKSKISVGR